MGKMITRIPLNLHSDWQKELAQCVTDPIQLLQLLEIDPTPLSEDIKARRLFPMRVPRPFVQLMQKGNLQDPLLQQVFCSASEFATAKGYSHDPLQEQDTPLPGLLHKYDTRVLIMLKGGCAINCRYCFRRHFPYQEHSLSASQWQDILDYLHQRPQINEVIFSGGDPLMAKDEHLQRYIEALAAIPHLKRIRIHTRLPVVLPQRLTPDLLSALTATRLKVVMVFHINHANELCSAFVENLQPFKNQILLLNQSVLLKGVNDSCDTLVALSEALYDANIQPYYLHMLDKVSGAQHFEVSLAQAQSLMQQILTILPGFLVPKLVREQATKASKTPIHF
ncbi:EF-P beta-lysylation protein EpmB [Paraferrimonas haliotis]|uniref:L-lysine 2,3-aminomutase n=1 Tax=Paraferrimonas haliotis TaxID=2013866 RepID=A0AA37WVQ6_9GAMM|nr:EF-P beta-lysylation protein EpmB [Paraferrimonas haliotis]GLS82412.1 EF-P beta-lysylation protein EpmB [Paraferrimonas haliotis]